MALQCVFRRLGLLGIMLIAPFAHAGVWSLGAGVAVENYPYKGVGSDVLPWPVVSYDDDAFYVKGLAAGAYVWKDRANQLSLDLYYSPLRFRPGKSDDWQMKRLDKRRASLMGGASYRHVADWGMIRTLMAADLEDNSNGVRAEAAYFYGFYLGSLRMTPGVGISWYSRNFNDYYYGIAGHEARRSGLRQYDAGSSWSPYLELSAHYQFNPHWSAFAVGRYTRLDSEVKDSPMVNKSYTGLMATGINYRF